MFHANYGIVFVALAVSIVTGACAVRAQEGADGFAQKPLSPEASAIARRLVEGQGRYWWLGFGNSRF